MTDGVCQSLFISSSLRQRFTSTGTPWSLPTSHGTPTMSPGCGAHSVTHLDYNQTRKESLKSSSQQDRHQQSFTGAKGSSSVIFTNTLAIKRASSRFTGLINPEHHTSSFKTNNVLLNVQIRDNPSGQELEKEPLNPCFSQCLPRGV